jgi:hypothetical protein
MRKDLLCVAAAVAIVACASSAWAADTLIYGFEPDAQGFAANGGGVTVAQDTFGATEGTHSLKYSVVGGATFVGALTGNVPAILNNPPGVDHVTFDMTIGPNDAFTGAFDVLGITIFGASQPGPSQQFGLQAQFAPLVHIEGLTPGTYTETIPLTGATNQVDFSTNQTFNQIFGSGANQQIPTGFEFFLNKSNDAASTVYIDNVRIGGAAVPEPASCALLAIGAVGAVLGFRRRRSR